MKINGIKANGKDYDIWATSAEVEALNNQGNAALGKELESGKQSIVDAINAKGVPATADESFSGLSEKIGEIPSNLSTKQIGCLIFGHPFNPLTQNDFTLAITDPTYMENPIVEIKDNNITRLPSYRFSNLPFLKKVTFNGITEIATETTYTFDNCSELEEANFNNLQFIRSHFVPFVRCNKLKKIIFPNLKKLGGSSFLGSTSTEGLIYVEEVYCPKLSNITSYNFYNCQRMRKLVTGKLTSIGTNTLTLGNCYRLQNIIIGEGTDINLSFQSVGANKIFGDEVDDNEWNENFRNGIIANLYDYSGGTAHSITLGAYAKAKLTQETIDMANNKGWNIL